jgi:V/A-type H+-transporting ATPase subunit E
MAIEDILARIESEAATEIEKARAAANAQKSAILAEAQAAADAITAAGTREATGHRERIKERLVSAARLEARNRLLAEKQKLISLAFERALESVQKLHDDKYRKLLMSLLVKNVERGDEIVVVSERDAVRLGADFVEEANKEIERTKSPSGKGRKGHLKILTQKAETGGGFILRSGRLEINFTFPAMLKAVRDRIETDVAGVLFG